MRALTDSLLSFFGYIWNQILSIRFTDVLDIVIISVLLFYIYRFIRQRRAGKLALGVAFLLVLLIISDVLNMHVLRYILTNVFQVGIIAILIVFQPELRSALEKMGGKTFSGLIGLGETRDPASTAAAIRETVDAVMDMSKSKTGALIVFERTTKLGDIIRTGTIINADVNAFLIKNIFFNKAPLHDGAAIISGNRINSAGCFLPLSMNQDIIKDLGTRHRAGIGMSENSDAVVVIVSEETGTISLAVEGRLTRDYTRETLTDILQSYLVTQPARKKFRKNKHESGEETEAEATDEAKQ